MLGMGTACLRNLRVSTQKLNDVAKPLRRKTLKEALRALSGMKKRVAIDVYKACRSALANAEQKSGGASLEERLWVVEASVGRCFALKRVRFCGRGRTGRVEKEFSQIRIVLMTQEQMAVDAMTQQN